MIFFHSKDEKDAEPKTKVRLIVPNCSSGGITGKGGATIRYHYFALSSCRAYLFASFMEYAWIKVVVDVF